MPVGPFSPEPLSRDCNTVGTGCCRPQPTFTDRPGNGLRAAETTDMKELSPALFAKGFGFLEAPRWRDGHLWLTDVFGCRIHRLDASGRASVWLDHLPPRPNSMNFLSDGSMVIVASVSRQILRVVEGGTPEVYADLSGLAPGDLNDFAVDAVDRLYVGNFGYDAFGGEQPRETSLVVVQPDGELTPGPAQLEFPNGTVIVDGGRTLITAESWRGRLTAFDRADDGSLSNPTLFAALEGRHPDGICADADGAVWAPCYNTGELLRVVRGGEVTHRHRFAGSAIACTIGGEDGRTLFCSTFAGSPEQALANAQMGEVYAVPVEVGAA